MKIKNYFIKIKNIIEKYEISIISSSTSFYMIIAIYSLLVLSIQFYNKFNNDFIINKLIDIMNNYYIIALEKIIPIFSINKYSPILFFNLIWSSSKYINGFNKVSDLIYEKSKKRNYFINRINSIIIFTLILCIIRREKSRGNSHKNNINQT